MLLDNQDTSRHEHRICNVMMEGRQLPALAVQGTRAVNSFFDCEQNMDTYTIVHSVEHDIEEEMVFYVCRRMDVEMIDIDRNSNIC